MKTTILIHVEKGADKFTVSISATVIGDYAYHHPYSEEGNAKTWAITHIPSGLALPTSNIWPIRNQKQAKQSVISNM